MMKNRRNMCLGIILLSTMLMLTITPFMVSADMRVVELAQNMATQITLNYASVTADLQQVKGAGGMGSLSNAKAIAAGGGHSLALKEDGTVWAWGWNDRGQLGDGTTTNRSTPVQIQGLSDVKAIVAGYNHSLALKDNGTVWAWGRNDSGQLGDRTTTNRSTPVQVKGAGGMDFLSNAKAIAAGQVYSLVLRNDGMVWAWGWNDRGQLGDGTTTNRSTPVQVKAKVVGTFMDLAGITAIAGGDAHSLALGTGWKVFAWGYNASPSHCSSKRIIGGNTDPLTSAVQVKGALGMDFLSNAKAIAAGNGHSLVLKNDGTVWAWGWNGEGQLGNNTNDSCIY
ncbi:MAG: hypothetical protein LBQ00_02495 [Syntrophobacterales bacterium]|jgi:alpha-tubulin suppressor-like RCC1 family protein|nr:hypothetical protein [Syntrophobacterales bacterium]